MAILKRFKASFHRSAGIWVTLLFVGICAAAIAVSLLISIWVVIIPALVIFILGIGADYGRQQARERYENEHHERSRDAMSGPPTV